MKWFPMSNTTRTKHESPLVVVRLQGGLGNQMFQYAFGAAVSVEFDARLKFDSRYLSSFETKRNLDLTSLRVPYEEAQSKDLSRFRMVNSDRTSPLLARLTRHHLFENRKVVREPDFGYHPGLTKIDHAGKYFIGYWQSYKYFEGIRQKLGRDLETRSALSPKAKLLEAEILGQKSICLNVRRGDFAHNPETKSFHGLMSIDYYTRALNALRSQGDFDRVFVFSDEPEWCRENFSFDKDLNVVSHSHAGPSFSHYLHLMKSCSGFVIPNSTFGWWAAWLSGCSADNVVAPEAWFASNSFDTQHLIPAGWTRV